MVLTTFEYQQGPLVARYMPTMSHNNGVVIKFGGELEFEYEEFPSNDDEGGVGGLNCTPCLMKPLVIMFPSLEFCVIFVMNCKPYLGYPPLKSDQE
jgi:hypothetical protein